MPTSLVAPLGGIVVLFVFYKLVLYPGWISPLAKIPNAHWLCPYTSLWIAWQRYTGKDWATMLRIVEEKGRIVRLGPKELLVVSFEKGISTIYGGNFDKPEWYDYYKHFGGTRNIFTSLGDRDHSTRRRRVARVWSKRTIQQNPHARHVLWTTIFQRFLPQIADSARLRAQPLPILNLSNAVALDAVSAYWLGLAQGTRFVDDPAARSAWNDAFAKWYSSRHLFWIHEMRGFAQTMARFGIHLIPKSSEEKHRWLEDVVLKLVDRSEEALKACAGGKDPENGDFPLVFSATRKAMSSERSGAAADDAKTLAPYEEQRSEIASEVLDNFGATTETFGTTFISAIWELSKHPEWQALLRHELLHSTPHLVVHPDCTAESMAAAQELEALPILNAVMKESMRLRKDHPTPDPRVTPLGRTTTLGPYSNIPGGVRTNSYARFVHLEPEVYPDPHRFDPGRFLQTKTSSSSSLSSSSAEKTEVTATAGADRETMERHIWIFSSGNRMCLGMHLAVDMMRYMLAAVYANFSTSVPDGEAGDLSYGASAEKLRIVFRELDADETVVAGRGE